MIVSTLEVQGAQYTGEALLVADVIRGPVRAGTGLLWSRVIAAVGVQPLFQRAGRQPQGLTPRRHFQRLKIPLGCGLEA